MIAIVDYGVGNLFSLSSSLKYVGADAVITGDKEELTKADKIILPGVGAFGDAIAKLKENGLDIVIKELAASGKPLMGICLGMQLLFDKSYEYGEHEGLGLIKGEVVPFEGKIDESLKIPHMGWNALKIRKDCAILRDIEEGDHVYFVHSFYAVNCEESTAAVCEYDVDVTAVVSRDNVYGCQFHPEKSGETGLKILKAFAEMGSV